jgi:hypothetical protein
MSKFLRPYALMLGLIAVGALAVSPGSALANDHVIAPDALHGSLLEKEQTRQANIDRINRFFASENVQRVLKDAHLDVNKAQKAVPMLSDEEVSRLAAQMDQVDSDFAAGLTRGQTTLVILAAAVVVIILVIAAAT